MHAAPSATQLSQWSLRMRRHAKARTARHCAVWELVRPTRLTGADIWPGLYIYIYIVYVYSFILVAAIWRCHNFTGFVASAKTVLENHVHVLKQFEAAVALPSTGHVQVSVPWDTCSQPQGVSTPLSLCRVGSNDKPAGDSVWQQPGVEKRALRPWFVLIFEWRPLFRKPKCFAGLSDNIIFEGREGSQSPRSPSVLRMTSDWF